MVSPVRVPALPRRDWCFRFLPERGSTRRGLAYATRSVASAFETDDESACVNLSAISPAERACKYRSVVVMRECPIAALTEARSIPPATSREPYVWRKSWNRNGQSNPITRPLHPTPHRRAIEATAEPVGEHVVVRACVIATLREAVQRSGGLIGQGDVAGPSRFRRGGLNVGADRARDDEFAQPKVDVAPPQCDELAAPQPRIGRHPYELCVLPILRGARIGLLLSDCRRVGITVEPRSERTSECLDLLG